MVFDYGHVETICCLSAEELFRRAGLLRLPWILQRLKIVQYLLLQPPLSALFLLFYTFLSCKLLKNSQKLGPKQQPTGLYVVLRNKIIIL